MKSLFLITCVCFLGLAQTPVADDEIQVKALVMRQDGSTTHLSGKVTIETSTIILEADQADFDNQAREILAHGDVRVKLQPSRLKTR